MRLALVSALAAVSTLALSAPALADTLVDNVDGVTIDAEGKVKRFNGLVFDEDGKITAVLTRSDKRPQVDYRLDGEGRVMIPGMIDAQDLVHPRLVGALTGTGKRNGMAHRIRPFRSGAHGRPWDVSPPTG